MVGWEMAEFVEEVGRYVFNRKAGTVATVMRSYDADGRIVERVTHCTTIQIFKGWCAQVRAVEAEIDAHLARENVVAMSDYRDQADTA